MIQRKLSDYAEQYLNPTDCGDPIIYEFDNTIEQENDIHLLYGLTTVKAGQINGEYYMTKGHIHSTPSAEIYYGISGSGIVLQENGNDIITTPIEAGSIVYCEPDYAHRLINTDNDDLQVFCVCRADAGHDYSYIFKHRCVKENI